VLFDGFSSSRAARCLDSGSGSGGRTRCLFPFPLPLTLAHALALTDLQWAMPVQVVSCTQSIQPRVSTMYTLDPRPTPTQPLHPPHASRPPSSHSRTLEILSPSLPYPQSPSSTTNSSLGTPEHVGSLPTLQPDFLYSPLSLSILFYSSSSVNSHIHPSQGRWRWIIWNGVVV
jgi:hypothetical protein